MSDVVNGVIADINKKSAISSDDFDEDDELDPNVKVWTKEEYAEMLTLTATRFEISKPDLKGNLDVLVYEENTQYHTKKYVKDVLKLEADIAFIDAAKYLSDKEIAIWKTSVEGFILEHNIKIVAVNEDTEGISDEYKIEYKILDVDENYSYKFEKYVNGELSETGEQWYRDIKTSIEKKAWRKAVKAYNKEHKISMPTDIIKSLIEDIKKILAKLDDGLFSSEGTSGTDSSIDLSSFSIDIPMLELALPKFTEDPCGFIQELAKAIDNGIATINGLPNPKEVAAYIAKQYKTIISTNAQTLVQSQKSIVSAVTEPIIEPLTEEEFLEAYEELDVQYHEVDKAYQKEWVTLKTCAMEDTIKVVKDDSAKSSDSGSNVITISVEDSGNSDGNTVTSGSTNLSGLEPVSSVPGLTADGLYKKIANTGAKSEKNGKVYVNKAPTNKEHTNIVYAINNCYIPLIKGWYSYCEKQGWIKESGWNNFSWNITSGFRSLGNGSTSDKNNYNYGSGSGTNASAHTAGFAIDMSIPARGIKKYQDMDIMTKLSNFIYDYSIKMNIPFDQLLHECYNPTKCEASYNWIHLGVKNLSGKQRGEYYTKYNPKGSAGKHDTYSSTGKSYEVKNHSFA